MNTLTISKELDLFPMDGGKLSVFHKTSRKTYQLGEKESRTLLCFDGTRTQEEVQALCPWYDPAQLSALVQAMIPLGFFREHPLKRKLDLLHLRLQLFNPDRLFSPKGHGTKLLARSIFLLCPGLLLLSLAMLLLMRTGVLPQPELSGAIQYYMHFSAWDVLGVLLLNLLCLGLHELGHAIVARYYGVNVPEIGVMLYFLFPVAYTNVSGLHLLTDRRKQLRILLAGSYVNLGLIGLSLLLLYFIPTPAIAAYATASILINLGTILLNCVIFLKFDGYYILEILLDEPGFRETAMQHFRMELSLFGRKHQAERKALHSELRKNPEESLKHLCYCAYSVLSTLFIPVLVGNTVLAVIV